MDTYLIHRMTAAGRPSSARGPRTVAFLAGGEREPDGTAEAAHGHVNLGAQAPAGAADGLVRGLIVRLPFAPAEYWWARMMVASTVTYSMSGSSDIASKMRHQTPLRLHRRNALFRSPNTSGRSRQGEPVRMIHGTPSTNIKLSHPVEPYLVRSADDQRSHAIPSSVA